MLLTTYLLLTIQAALGLLFVELVGGLAFQDLSEDEQSAAIEEAVRSKIPGELAKHAISEGKKSGVEGKKLEFEVDEVAI